MFILLQKFLIRFTVQNFVEKKQQKKKLQKDINLLVDKSVKVKKKNA